MLRSKLAISIRQATPKPCCRHIVRHSAVGDPWHVGDKLSNHGSTLTTERCVHIQILVHTLHYSSQGPQSATNYDTLRALTAKTTRERHVLRLDSNALGVNRSQVGVLEEADEVCLARLLESADGRRLEAKVGLEVLSNLTNETLERKLADQKLRALLVATNFTESHRTRLVTVRLFYCIGLAQDMHVIIHTTTSHRC